MQNQITLTVNGQTHTLAVDADETLADVLRNRLHLTGTKIGCEEAECGVCTVNVDGEPTMSCVYPAQRANGKNILTIEGLAKTQEGELILHPLQDAFREHHGLQCGYCTPGMITRAWRLLQENPDPDEDEIRQGIAGNLCRCTGYQNIVKAVRAAADTINASEEAAE